MRASQAQRSRIAARTPAPSPRPIGPASTDLRARILTVTERAIPATRNRKSPRMTATQKDSTGQKSAWSASPYFWTAPAWDHTASTMPRGE